MSRFYPLLCTLLLLAFSAPVNAQATQAAAQSTVQSDEPLSEVRIEGASDLKRNLINVTLSARAGTPVSQLDLEGERDRLLSIGDFSEVSLDIEDRGGGPILFVRVVENPTIGEVAVEGSSFPSEALLPILNESDVVTPGATYNTRRAEEARRTLQEVYRAQGFPFDVPVVLNVEPLADEAVEDEETEAGATGGVTGGETGGADVLGAAPQDRVRLVYTVSEDVPVDEVVFGGATVLDEERLDSIFRPLVRAEEFSYASYQAAVGAVSEAYQEAGYRGSGVDPARSSLEDGTLTLGIRELRIAGVDTTAIGVDPSELSLQEGDLFNYDALLSDVRRLAAGRTQDVRLETLATPTGDVRVIFASGPPDSAGVIEAVQIEGNTVVPTEELLELLTLEVGDTFSSGLAEEDFARIVERYQEEGYRLVLEPDFNYLDGVYLQRLREIEVAGYEIEFEDGVQRTNESVITRYLPDVGTVYNEAAFVNALRTIARLGAVTPLPSSQPTLPEGNAPDEAVLRVAVRENQTRTFRPAANYSTDQGFSASISYGDTNFLGSATNFGAELAGQTSDIGLLLGASVTYSVPWLYLDFLDFQEVPTSLSASLYSTAVTNQPLSADGSSRILFPGLPPLEENRVRVGDYTQRNTGVRFSIGRPVFDNTLLRFSASAAYARYSYEPGEDCEVVDNVVAEPCALPRDFALQYLPQSGLASFLGLLGAYDTRDSLDFPRSGLVGTGQVGLGFGSDYRNPDTNLQQRYTYEQLELGFKTYLKLEDIIPSVNDPNHVFAFKINAGTQFGGDYPESKRFVVGDTPDEATGIRGYTSDDFGLSRTYVTSSLEYRYDFGLDTVATQTLIGVVFADIGYASSVPGFDDYSAPLFASAGLGAQINFGFGGIGLPPVRLDYGFSERHPRGRFSFSLGAVF